MDSNRVVHLCSESIKTIFGEDSLKTLRNLPARIGAKMDWQDVTFAHLHSMTLL